MKLSGGTPRTCTRCSLRNFVFQEGGLTSWTVARKLQQAQCWRAAQIAASFPGTIQRGFYNREPAHESRSGKIATNSTKNCSTYILTKLEKSVPVKSVEDNVLCWLTSNPSGGALPRLGYWDVLVVREIDCGDWLAREYLPAHQHCGLFYSLVWGLA